MTHRSWSFGLLTMATLAVTLGLAAAAGAQWTLTPSPQTVGAPRAADTLDEPETVLGIWRATGVAFESHGHRTLLEARVTATQGGIHLIVPSEMGLPGGTAFDLTRVAPMIFRATDRVGRITTFRVAGSRAELLVTGADGSGLVTFQFDEHEPPR